jgi:hypothetical protein
MQEEISMETTVKQMLDLGKASVDNSFETMVMIQNQMENITNTVINQNRKMVDETQKTISSWSQAYKKGNDDLRKVVASNMEKMEKVFGTWTSPKE